MQWKDGARAAFKIKKVSVNGVPQLVFLTVSPLADTQKAWQKKEEEWVELTVIEVNSKKYLQLVSSQADIRLESPSGATHEFSYALDPREKPFVVDGQCHKSGVKVKFLSKQPSKYPAILTCDNQGKILSTITFVSTQDAEWLGSEAFETGGKGEHWKSFDYKDVMNLDKWNLSWGSEEDKNKVWIHVPKPSKPQKKLISPSITMSVGAEYIIGTIQKNTLSEKIGAVIVPIRVVYQKEKQWWSLGGGYDFFGYALQKGTAGSNSLSKFEIWGGAETGSASFKLRGTLGYISRTIDAPTAGISVGYDAPRVGVDLFSQGQDQSFGVNTSYATTSAGGSYTEMSGALYYQAAIWWKLQSRIQVNYTQLKSSTTTLNATANWFGLGLNIQF